MTPLFISMPHSGEQVPKECQWLQPLDEKILMCDVDRFIDLIYEPLLKKSKIDYCKTQWHRYAVDLNRIPSDIDQNSVQSSLNPKGSFNRGYHWVYTTLGDRLMPEPMTPELHTFLTELIYIPFHQDVQSLYQKFKDLSFSHIFHIDAHSMPSVGTQEHRDPGQRRADIVVSDCLGKSCSKEFKDLVIEAYENAGFRVAYNWPYVGGRLTEQYGKPELGQQAIQVELNRALYMNEQTKKLNSDYSLVQSQIEQALLQIKTQLGDIKLANIKLQE